MPRKSKIQPRNLHKTKKIKAHTKSRSPNTMKQTYYQCLGCGAPADPMFGLGKESWCPSCQESGHVASKIGHMPDPVLYGHWYQQQAEIKASPNAILENDLSPHQSLKGESSMKHKKLHTGIYCCPDCCIEYDLMAEESLKCDHCQEPLVKGSLEEAEEGEDDVEDCSDEA